MHIRILILIAFLLNFSALFGAVEKFTDATVFSGESVKVDFENLADGARVATVYDGWGVQFGVSDQSQPATHTIASALGTFNNVVRNVNPQGSSANVPLILNFFHPVSKVGFFLGNGTVATEATISAFGPDGTSLGSIQQDQLDEPQFVGISTDDPAGMSKVVISYGAAAEEEQIDDLTFEYLVREAFEVALAAVGDGPIPDLGGFRTTIVISNLTNSTAVGEISFFRGEGASTSITVEDSGFELTGSSFDFSIPAFGSRTLTTIGDSAPIFSGYARIVSNVPVEATAIFQVVTPEGELLTEAGVGSAVGKVISVGAAQRFTVGNLNSGIAVVNLGSAAGTASVRLRSETGTTSNIGIPLQPGEHQAQFLSEMFPQFDTADFQGTLTITSSQPLALVILRTADGLPFSSLPVGSTEK
jgi:hypothetical protein